MIKLIGNIHFYKLFSTIDGIHTNEVYYHALCKTLGIYTKKTEEEHGILYWIK